MAATSPSPFVLSAFSKMSQATSISLSGLTGPQSSVQSDPLAAGLDEKVAEDNKANATMLANSQMTSADVNTAMYGKGVTAVDGPKATVSFQDIIARERADLVETNVYFSSNSTGLSPDIKQSQLKQDVDYSNFLDQIQSAYDNHTLVF